MNSEAPDFSISGEFVADVCTAEQLAALHAELPDSWSEGDKGRYTAALHTLLQARWRSVLSSTEPFEYWKDRSLQVSKAASEMQQELVRLRHVERLYMALDVGLLASRYAELRDERDGPLPELDAESIETLCRRLWRDLERLRFLAASFAGGIELGKSKKVSTYNASLLALCLVDAHVAVFGRVPPHSKETPFVKVANRAGELLGLTVVGEKGHVRVGQKLLEQATKKGGTRRPPP